MKLVENSQKRLKLGLNIAVLLWALVGVTRRDLVLQETSAFENLLIDFFAPIQRGVSYLHGNVTSVFNNYVANVNASKENTELSKRISELENEIFRYTEMELENKRLKGLLEFGSEVPRKKVLAQIVAWDANSDFRVLRINKGLNDGIKLQSTVVTSNGLVGYIYRLTDHFSDILTILDPNNRVDALIKRTRSHGIVEGYSSQRCSMKYVTRTEPVILNDTVLTSGLGNIYPKGIKIGTVSRIERESYGITQYLEVSPSVDFSRLEEVVVLVSGNNVQKMREWEALDKQEEEERK